MKRYIDELMKRIDELIKTYELFMWKEKDRHLVVAFYDENIMSFYLYDSSGLIDTLSLEFEDNEDTFFKAVCLKTFTILLGNVKVKHETDEDSAIYYNEKIKPEILVVAVNKEISSLINEMISNQDKETIKNNIVLKNAHEKVKMHLPNTSVIKQLDRRIEISKEMLRRY